MRSDARAAFAAAAMFVGCSVYEPSLLTGEGDGTGAASGRGGSGGAGGTTGSGGTAGSGIGNAGGLGAGGSAGGSAGKGTSGTSGRGGQSATGGGAGATGDAGENAGGETSGGESGTGGSSTGGSSTGGSSTGGSSTGGSGGSSGSSAGNGGSSGAAAGGAGQGGTTGGAGGSAGKGGSSGSAGSSAGGAATGGSSGTAGSSSGMGGSSGTSGGETCSGCARLSVTLANIADKAHFLITLPQNTDFTSAVLTFRVFRQAGTGGQFRGYVQHGGTPNFAYLELGSTPLADINGWQDISYDLAAVTGYDKTVVRRLGIELIGAGATSWTDPTVLYVDSISVTNTSLDPSEFPFAAIGSVSTTPSSTTPADQRMWLNSGNNDTNTDAALRWLGP